MTERECSVEGCERSLTPPYGRGMCGMHYKRWRRHGDPTLDRVAPRWPAVCTVDDCAKPTVARGWCSAHWTRWQRHGSPTFRVPGEVVNGCRICLACGQDKTLSAFTPNQGGPCKDCLARRKRVRLVLVPTPPKLDRDLVCPACRTPFRGNGKRYTYCSRECFESFRHKANWKHVTARRARERAAATTPFRRHDVFERDGWICGICHDPIDKSLPWPHLMSAVLDHVFPISRGGAHSIENAQAAHNGCNIRKSNKILEVRA